MKRTISANRNKQLPILSTFKVMVFNDHVLTMCIHEELFTAHFPALRQYREREIAASTRLLDWSFLVFFSNSWFYCRLEIGNTDHLLLASSGLYWPTVLQSLQRLHAYLIFFVERVCQPDFDRSTFAVTSAWVQANAHECTSCRSVLQSRIFYIDAHVGSRHFLPSGM